MTDDKKNMEEYWKIMQKVDPDFYIIRLQMQEARVNPMLIPRIIRAIANLAVGTRYGKVSIYMQDGVITNVEGIERDNFNDVAILDDDSPE